MKAPCRDCEEREIGCHGKCEEYRRYKIKHYAESIYEYRNKMREKIADNVHFENCRKTEKKARHK